MTQKMSVIYGNVTGHVLGVVTRAGVPDGKAQVKDLIGDGLLIRDATLGETLLTVEEQWLKVTAVDFLGDLVGRPTNYSMDNDQAVFLTKDLDADPVHLTQTGVKVKFPAALASGAKVWVLVEGGPGDARIAKDAAPAAGPPAPTDVTIPIGLQPGDYRVLALVPGYRPFAVKTTL